MSVNKQPILPHMVRSVPEQFSWVDHRLVQERYIDCLSHGAAALYLFLVTVSDARGLSYYGDKTLEKRLNMEAGELKCARDALVRQRLIAYSKPLYQILSLDHQRQEVAVDEEPCAIGDILRQEMGGGQ